MVRRACDAFVLLVVLANGYHLAVSCCRYVSAKRTRAAYIDQDLTNWLERT